MLSFPCKALASWKQTLLFCLSRFILPCRSLCMAVRDGCAPVLACQGHAWPEALDCDRFPAEEDMCLSPHPKFSLVAKGTYQPPQIQQFILCGYLCKCCFANNKLKYFPFFHFLWNVNSWLLFFFFTDLPKPACQNCPSVEEYPAMKTVLDTLCLHDFGEQHNLIQIPSSKHCKMFSWNYFTEFDQQQKNSVNNFPPFFLFTAVTAKLHRRRLPSGEPEFQVEGRVEFIRQGPLLPYDTQHLLQQWLLINLRCAHALVRPGRSQLYLIAGTVQPDASLAITRLFPWHKKDTSIATATRKWKHHRCWRMAEEVLTLCVHVTHDHVMTGACVKCCRITWRRE